MARRAFYSFHYKPDNWRASQVRNMGVVEGNSPATDHNWETVTSGGDAAIATWITEQMTGKSCVIVLIGSATSGRKWINYEIKKAWNDKRGLLGIHIHRLKDVSQSQTTMGVNPFNSFNINQKPLSSIIKTYNPPYSSSTDVYKYIKDNLVEWIETAISIRNSI